MNKVYPSAAAALDGVVGVLKVAAAKDSKAVLRDPVAGQEALGILIAKVPAVGSLSLVDASGRIVASSSPGNQGEIGRAHV